MNINWELILWRHIPHCKITHETGLLLVLRMGWGMIIAIFMRQFIFICCIAISQWRKSSQKRCHRMCIKPNYACCTIRCKHNDAIKERNWEFVWHRGRSASVQNLNSFSQRLETSSGKKAKMSRKFFFPSTWIQKKFQKPFHSELANKN